MSRPRKPQIKEKKKLFYNRIGEKMTEYKPDMTYEGLAEKLGVSRESVYKWRIQANQPPLKMIYRIAKILNCSAQQLIYDYIDQDYSVKTDLRRARMIARALDFGEGEFAISEAMKIIDRYKR